MPASRMFNSNGYVRVKGGEGVLLGECLKNLSAAVIHQAYQDYVHVLTCLYKSPKDTTYLQKKRELDAFFESERYKFFTDIPADKIVARAIEVAKMKHAQWGVAHPA